MIVTTNETRTDQLGGLELFAGVSRETLELVAARCIELDVPAGRELCREGEQAREFVVVLEGHAQVMIKGYEIAYLGPASCFGEMALIDGRKRAATVTAATQLRALVFDADDFHFLLRELPSFAQRILTMVVGRLRLANSQLSERAGAMNRSPSQWSPPTRSANLPTQ